MLEALKPWIVLTLLLWALFLLALAAWRAPKATARAFERLGVISVALVFTVALVPIGLFFGAIYGARLGREFYTEILPRHWTRER